jgi:hypothetical protein
MEEDDELYWSIVNLIDFTKNSGVESCDCDNCTIIRNSLSHCQHFVETYKTKRKMQLN